MAWDEDVARQIVRIGEERGLGQREIVAALSTGLVESGLQNISHGDRDSLGVFQQRPSQGWGSPEQLTDVEYATNRFYDSIGQFDKDGITGAELAARIQRPAAEYRDRYAERWGEARSIYRQVSGNGSQAAIRQGATSGAGPFGGGGPPQGVAGTPTDSREMFATMMATLSDQVAGRDPSARLSVGGSAPAPGGVATSGLTGAAAQEAGQAILGRRGQGGTYQDGEPMQVSRPGESEFVPELGEVTPGKGGVPKGLQQNAARGAAAVRKAFGFNGAIGGLGKRDNPSDHPDGNAIDVMTNSNVELGEEISEFFVNNRDALGVKYVIFNRTIWSERNDWQPRRMADRGSPTANHVDHPHISFHG